MSRVCLIYTVVLSKGYLSSYYTLFFVLHVHDLHYYRADRMYRSEALLKYIQKIQQLYVHCSVHMRSKVNLIPIVRRSR
jgi:hypothetical protein